MTIFPVRSKEGLSDEQQRIGLRGGTEKAFTEGNFHQESRGGSYCCAACDTELFVSAGKFDSGTGWPSFFEPVSPDVVATSKDFKLILPRTEVHCARCGFHLGHVFRDGPQPTGLRYCINGTVLVFHPSG